MIQRIECFSSATVSHLKIAQKTIAVKNEELAYTSPSTAENQNESLNVYAKAPTRPAPMTAINWEEVDSAFPITIFLARAVMVQKRNKIVNALISAERTFTIIGCIFTLSPPNKIKILPSIRNKGAPGGCPTSSFMDVAMNSPQSQKLPVGSIVDM